jgi:hypothetical protein
VVWSEKCYTDLTMIKTQSDGLYCNLHLLILD